MTLRISYKTLLAFLMSYVDKKTATFIINGLVRLSDEAVGVVR